MKELIPKDDFGIFADMKQTARVDSLYVAVLFEREHRNILISFRNCERIAETPQDYHGNDFEIAVHSNWGFTRTDSGRAGYY